VWLAFLDDDNEWAPDYLERQLALAEAHPDAAVVYCRARCHDARTGRDTVMPAAIWEERVFRHLVTGWIPVVSGALLRRSALTEVGGLDEELAASEDRDLWLRLALRTNFAGTADVLVMRHEHPGARLSRRYALLVRDAEVLDRKWKAAIKASCGWAAYRRWRALLIAIAEMVGVTQALERQERLDAARSVWRMACHLPWSAPRVVRGLAMTVLGLPAYRRLGALRSALRADRGRTAVMRRRGPAEPRAMARAARND
jgi:hypothetical protein